MLSKLHMKIYHASRFTSARIQFIHRIQKSQKLPDFSLIACRDETACTELVLCWKANFSFGKEA